MTLEPGKEGVTKGTRDATRMARVFSRAIIRSSNFNFSLFLVVFISPCLLSERVTLLREIEIVIFLVNKIVRLLVASDQGRLNLQLDLRKKKFINHR